MSTNKYNIKTSCDSDKCSFRDVIFDTFSFITCDGCKTEVSKELVEYKSRPKEEQIQIEHNTNNEEFEDMLDMFDFWSRSQ